MSDSGDVLLVGEAPATDAMARQIGRHDAVTCALPYEALMEMARRRWPTVLLAAPQPDFAGLCRAARRLQPDAAIFGLCPAPAEPQAWPPPGL